MHSICCSSSAGAVGGGGGGGEEHGGSGALSPHTGWQQNYSTHTDTGSFAWGCNWQLQLCSNCCSSSVGAVGCGGA